MTPLSPSFTLEELTFSQVALRKGIYNDPNAAQVENLTTLCLVLLEPVRALLSQKAGELIRLHVDSGFRCSELNTAVGGAVNSAHLDGRAADVIPIGMELSRAFDLVRSSSLPFDQVIIECNAWLHLSVPRAGSPARLEALLASGSPGHWRYEIAPPSSSA